MLSERDDSLLAAYVADERTITSQRLRRALVSQTRRCLVHPVFFGSAITGEGVDPLRLSLVDLLPTEAGDPGAAPAGRVFDRGAGGERTLQFLGERIVTTEPSKRGPAGTVIGITAIVARAIVDEPGQLPG